MPLSNVDIVSHKDRIDHLFGIAGGFEIPALQQHWPKYLCVLVSGFVEVSIRILLVEYATSQSSPEVAHFVGQRLRMFQNAKMGKILELVGAFDVVKQLELADYVEGELKDAINSIVSNRHLIAHGQSVNISLANCKNYFDRAVRVIAKVEELFPS